MMNIGRSLSARIRAGVGVALLLGLVSVFAPGCRTSPESFSSPDSPFFSENQIDYDRLSFTGETFSFYHPGLVMRSVDLLELLAQHDLPPGFEPSDWEYRRNDGYLGIGGRSGDIPEGFYSFEQDEYFTDNDRRPRVHRRIRIRSRHFGPTRR